MLHHLSHDDAYHLARRMSEMVLQAHEKSRKRLGTADEPALPRLRGDGSIRADVGWYEFVELSPDAAASKDASYALLYRPQQSDRRREPGWLVALSQDPPLADALQIIEAHQRALQEDLVAHGMLYRLSETQWGNSHLLYERNDGFNLHRASLSAEGISRFPVALPQGQFGEDLSMAIAADFRARLQIRERTGSVFSIDEYDHIRGRAVVEAQKQQGLRSRLQDVASSLAEKISGGRWLPTGGLARDVAARMPPWHSYDNGASRTAFGLEMLDERQIARRLEAGDLAPLGLSQVTSAEDVAKFDHDDLMSDPLEMAAGAVVSFSGDGSLVVERPDGMTLQFQDGAWLRTSNVHDAVALGNFRGRLADMQARLSLQQEAGKRLRSS